MEPVINSRHAKHIEIDGKLLKIFSSNDYLGLSHHPEVLQNAKEAADRFGCGTGGSPATSGYTSLHNELASEIADFKNRDKGIVFTSGYATNIALHQCLGDNNTIFFSDEKNHPSVIDGLKLSGCPVYVYRHLDTNHLEELLLKHDESRRIVTTCSVFTIDGEICGFDSLAALKDKYKFLLIVDEAHATGCIGKTGRGIEEMFSLTGVADFLMGTFSKALGSQGGFLTFSEKAAEMLVKQLRAYQYSTALSAPCVAASLAALKVLKQQPKLVSKMRTNARRIYDTLSRHGFELNEPERHIINVYFKNREETTRVINLLKEKAYFVVPINTDNRWGLRITAMASHEPDEIDDFCSHLIRFKAQLNQE